MGSELDLDDVVSGHPLAQRELDDLRARVRELEADFNELGTHVRELGARLGHARERADRLTWLLRELTYSPV